MEDFAEAWEKLKEHVIASLGIPDWTLLGQQKPMTLEEAFLADIIANPKDDAPRLAYSDWLQERGDYDRSEFIQVQCKSERLPRFAGITLEKPITVEQLEGGRSVQVSGLVRSDCLPQLVTDPVPIGRLASDLSVPLRFDNYEAPKAVLETLEVVGPGISRARFRLLPVLHDGQVVLYRTHGDPAQLLRNRERELLARYSDRWLAQMTPDGLASYYNPGRAECGWLSKRFGEGSKQMPVVFRRGFPAEITCTLADWCGAEECLTWGNDPCCDKHCILCHGTGRAGGHGPALCHATPLERVTLTDVEPEHVERDPGFNPWRCPDILPFKVRGFYSHPEAVRLAISEHALEWAKSISKK